METIDIVEPAVPGLGHHRQAPPITGLIGRTVLDAPGNRGIARHADTVRIRNHHRALQESALCHPMRASHFAVAIQAEEIGVDRIVERFMTARDDRGHTSPHRALAGRELSFAADQSGVTDFHSSHVSDGVEFSRRAIKRNAQVSRANRLAGRHRDFRRRRNRLAREGVDCQQEHAYEHELQPKPLH